MNFYGFFGGPGGGGGSGGGVTSFNGLTGAVVLAAGANITLTPAGNTITIASTGGGGGTPFQETPAGAVNNVNTVFTASQVPSSAAAFSLYLDGLIQDQGVDYTLVGAVATFAVAPNFAQEVYCTYVVSSGGDVTSLNGASGAVTVVAGTGISVGTVGTVITVTNTGVASTVLQVDGTRGSPQLITAVGGLSFSGSQPLTKKYIAGNGGAIVVTANPQIAAGNADGQELTIQSRSAGNIVELQDGTGLVMNGPWIGGLDSSITFTWDTASWVEKCRQ